MNGFIEIVSSISKPMKRRHSADKPTSLLAVIILAALLAVVVAKWIIPAARAQAPFNCNGDICTISKKDLYELIKQTGEDYALHLCGWAQSNRR